MLKRKKQSVLNKIISIFIFITIVYILSSVFLKFYGKYGSKKFADEFSPGKRYRVEYYIPLDHKSILFPVDNPFFIKIYDFKEKKYIFESDVYEMGQGTGISWPQRGLPNIIVGTSIITHDLELEEYHAAP